jgi:hypothetical protein
MACEDPATTSREKSVMPFNPATGQQATWPAKVAPIRKGGVN